MDKVYIEVEVDEKNKSRCIEEIKKLGYNIKEEESEDKEEKEGQPIDGKEIKRQYSALTGNQEENEDGEDN